MLAPGVSNKGLSWNPLLFTKMQHFPENMVGSNFETIVLMVNSTSQIGSFELWVQWFFLPAMPIGSYRFSPSHCECASHGSIFSPTYPWPSIVFCVALPNHRDVSQCVLGIFCCILPHTYYTYSEPENDHFENDYHLPNLHFFWGGQGSIFIFQIFYTKTNMANPFTTPFPFRPTDCTFIAYIMHNSPGLGLQISGELVFIGNLRVYLVRHGMGWGWFFWGVGREITGMNWIPKVCLWHTSYV